MTENQKRRIEDRLPGRPLQWDEESANDEIVALHRQLAAEKLRADQGWERAEAKSKECIELREVLAQAGVRAEPVGYARESDLAKLADKRVAGVGMMIHKEGSEGKTALYLAAPTTPAQVPAAEVRRAALEEAAKACDEIESDRFDAYKGRGKHAPNNPDRADQYMNGKSDGAGECAAAIRSLAQSSTADKASEVRAASQAALDVLTERRRQIEQEGWTPEHDDKYSNCELARAAATYALCSHIEQLKLCGEQVWPWHPDWWKRTTYRRDLIKAGALILAEVERVDRAAAPSTADSGNTDEKGGDK